MTAIVMECLPVVREPSGCWLWTGKLTEHGYGSWNSDGQPPFAHREVYEGIRGAVPDGLVLDHLCRNRPCVNPDHLEVVPPRENTRRGAGPTAENAAKTHCAKGHEFTPENTVRRPNGSRRCRKCNNSRNSNRTHCVNGHEYTADNIVFRADGSRRCRECMEAVSANHASKTHCPNGHEYTPENTLTLSDGGRQCRTCKHGEHGVREQCPLGHRYDEANTLWSSAGRKRCRACQEQKRQERLQEATCKRGHVMDEANTILTQTGRRCRACKNLSRAN